MKKSLLRLLALCLMLAMLVPLAAACGQGPSDPNDSDPTDTTLPGGTTIAGPTDGYKTDLSGVSFTEISADALAGYTVVYSELASADALALANAVAAAVKEATGVELPVVSDRVAYGTAAPTNVKEIRVGITNRDTNYGWLRYHDYRIEKNGESLVLAAGGDEALEAAVEVFTEELLANAKLRLPSSAVEYLAYYAAETLYLNGVSIENYVIVRDADNATVAVYLQQQIRNLCGITIPMALDTAAESRYEILIGNLSRPGVTYPESGTYTVKQVGTKVVLGGVGENAGYAATMDFVANTLKYDKDKTGASLAISVKTTEATHLLAGLYKLNLDDEFSSMVEAQGTIYNAQSVYDRFMAAKGELPDEVTVLKPFEVEDYPLSLLNQVFVSPTKGDDRNPGTEEAPKKTITAALENVNLTKGGVVWLMGGTYELTDEIYVGTTHSGTATSPLFIKAWKDEVPVLTGNKKLDTSAEKWEYLDENANSDVWNRIPEGARDEIMYTTLEIQGWDDGDIAEITKENGPPRLYVGDTQYSLARYPNSDAPLDLLYFGEIYDTGSVYNVTGSDLYPEWVKRAVELPDGASTAIGWEVGVLNSLMNKGPRDAEERVKADEMAEEILSWVNTGEIWYFGSTFESWEFGHYKLALTHTEAGVTTTWGHKADLDEDGVLDDCWYLGYPRAFHGDDKGTFGNGTMKSYVFHPDMNKGGTFYTLKSSMPNNYGAKWSTNGPAGRNTFYLYNAIEALDAPGEWFLDRETGILYVYPDGDLETEGAAFSSTEAFAMLHTSLASYVVIDGIHINGSNSYGVWLGGGNDTIVQRVEIANTKKPCVYGSGKRMAVLNSDFSRSGSSMVNLGRSSAIWSMIPDRNVIQNNYFHDALPTVQAGSTLSGCGNVTSHNYYQNTVISGGGYECIVEYNRFEGGSADVVDGGMIYVGGSSAKYNHYRFNVFHMFNATHNAIYNDTMNSDNYAYYNIVSTIGSRSNSNKAWYSSTGMGNVCYGNLFILRNPYQVAAAGSVGGDEGDVVAPAGSGDKYNQSALFYYHFGADWGSGTKGAYTFVAHDEFAFDGIDGNETKILNLDNNNAQMTARQSLAGHWWPDHKDSEYNNRYNSTSCDVAKHKERTPAYMNHLLGTKLVRDAANDPSETYDVKYFYAPWYLCGETYTATGLPTDMIVTIPEYRYVEDDASGNPHYVTVEEHYVPVGEDGEITLTYEELGAMERLRRQPAYCVIMNNVVLGGTPMKNATGGMGDSSSLVDTAKVLTDDCSSYIGYVPTAMIGNNFYYYYYPDIVPYADEFEYDVTPQMWENFASGEMVGATGQIDLEAMYIFPDFHKGMTGPVHWTDDDYFDVFDHNYYDYMGWIGD